MVFALVGGSLIVHAETGFPLSGDTAITQEDWYSELDAGSYGERWRYLWSPLIRRNGVETRWRYRIAKGSITRDYILRSRYHSEKWEVGVGIESDSRPDEKQIAGFLALREEPYRIWLGDIRPGLPGGLLLSDRTRIVWSNREHAPITGSIDPAGDLFGGALQSQYRMLQFSIGGGEERRKLEPTRLYWGSLGWSDDTRWQFDGSGLFSAANRSSNPMDSVGYSLHSRWYTPTEVAEATAVWGEHGSAYALSALSRGFGTVRAEWFGRQGAPPVERAEMRYRNIEQGVWLEQRWERDWEYRTAVEFTQSLTREKTGKAFFGVVSPVLRNGQWSGYISARRSSKLGSLVFHRMGLGDSWGTGGKIAYNTGLLKPGWSGSVGGYGVRRISDRFRLTLWATVVYMDQSANTQTFSPVLPTVSLSGQPTISVPGGYCGTAMQWNAGRWQIQGEAWGNVFSDNRSDRETYEFRLLAGYDLE
ncbi:MAG: hypothetical protein OEM52_03110 [bacterium]|nr:hypothetical protein [bacterium]